MNPQLFAALRTGDIKALKELLAKGVSIKQTTELGSTPILVAAAFGQIDMFMYLLKNYHGRLHERNHNGNTPLLLAALNGHIPMVEYLLKGNLSKSNERNKNGDTALLLAVVNSQIPMVEFLLKNKYGTLRERNNYGNTAILLASLNGDIPMLDFLLSKPGASLRDRDTDGGGSALTLAAWKGHVDTVIYLINRGAYIDIPLKQDIPLGSVEGHGNQTALNLFIASKDLIWAARHNSETLEFFLKFAGRDPDVIQFIESLLNTLDKNLNARQYSDGNTALHLAIKNRNIFLMKALLEKGANLEITNHAHETPFQLAVRSNDPYFTALVGMAKIERLSLKIKTKEVKDTKELKAIHEQLEDATSLLLDAIANLKETSGHSTDETYLMMGLAYANPNTSYYNPVLAYELLQEVDEDNVPLSEKANSAMFELIIGGHVRLQKDGLDDTDFTVVDPRNGLEFKEDEESRSIRLKTEIRHLILSKPEDKTIMNKIIAEYALGQEQSMVGIKGVEGSDVDSQLALIEKMREMNLENKRLREALRIEREKTAPHFGYQFTHATRIKNIVDEKNLKSGKLLM